MSHEPESIFDTSFDTAHSRYDVGTEPEQQRLAWPVQRQSGWHGRTAERIAVEFCGVSE